MKTNNSNSLIVTQADNCAANQSASKQALFAVLLLNRWVGNNRCANQAWKKLASILPLSLVLMQVPMSKAQAAPLIQCSNVSFQTQAIFGIGSYTYPISVTVGDFNGDDKQDLVTAKSSDTTVSVLLGNGDGSFQRSVDYAAVVSDGSYPHPDFVTVGDFNGDDKQDLVTANSSSGNVSVLLGKGDGTFPSVVNYAVGSVPISVTVGDVNGDGKQDLATANSYSDTVSVLLGKGDGTFPSAVDYAVGSYPHSVTVGDFNSDGKQDLVTANPNSSTVSVLLGNGDGTFQPQATFAVGSGPYSVTIGDVNGDGKQDLATANLGSDTVSVLLGKGDGTFPSVVNYAVGSVEMSADPSSVTVGDFNGDDKQDLVTANSYSDTVSVLQGKGDGTFRSVVNYAAWSIGSISHPISVTVGDFNSDGRQDLVTANYNSGNVSVLLNNCTPAAPPDKTPAIVTATVTTSASSKQVQIAVQDIGSGLSSIVISASNNAIVTIPSFEPGTKNPVVVTTKQINPSKGLSFQVRVTDRTGNVSTSDLATLMIGATGKPVALNLTKVIQQESIVQILNSTPGLTNLRLSVNGTNFQESSLVDNEVRVIDISSALKLNNTITIKALGKPNGMALIWIREPSTP